MQTTMQGGEAGIFASHSGICELFHFMERLADQQVTEALRMRLEWKYALHLLLEANGIDFSVLSEFRDRLIEGEAEKRVFEKLVEEILLMGLIEELSIQRSDSIVMLVKVWRSSRIMRLAKP